MTTERDHSVVGAQEGCRAGQFSADTLFKRDREMMSIRRVASQRAGKIMSRASASHDCTSSRDEKGDVVQPQGREDAVLQVQ